MVVNIAMVRRSAHAGETVKGCCRMGETLALFDQQPLKFAELVLIQIGHDPH